MSKSGADGAAIVTPFEYKDKVEQSKEDKEAGKAANVEHITELAQKDGVFDTYFTNEEATCPATTCTMKKVGCTEAYVEDEANKGFVSIVANKIVIDRSNDDGNKVNFCLSCSNTYVTKTTDNIEISQPGSSSAAVVIIIIVVIVLIGAGGGFAYYKKTQSNKDTEEAAPTDVEMQKGNAADYEQAKTATVETEVAKEDTARTASAE